jgi:hypothetical protein
VRVRVSLCVSQSERVRLCVSQSERVRLCVSQSERVRMCVSQSVLWGEATFLPGTVHSQFTLQHLAQPRHDGDVEKEQQQSLHGVLCMVW